ncbi:trafficking kinesin-binding protein 1 isoform X3 [Chiloscyllium plagiosum]|uniref:trafficking kinesin-binding protein 1 isoform X3 n=1 Tax=Chiloscyllium plagiosum TaxID=36176 RepID=UPI001CB8433B|nr:trafficking kinesin-binding protein 1 isoform X3 [Chiloscyllium plagiosum]
MGYTQATSGTRPHSSVGDFLTHAGYKVLHLMLCVEGTRRVTEPGLVFSLSDQGASTCPINGNFLDPVKPVKLDATAISEKTSADTLSASETLDCPFLACTTGSDEVQYVSEAVCPEDASSSDAHRDACTITDVCNSTDLPEVEIISLLEEQLPHYKLRADTIYGYDHDDWLHTPLISPDVNLDLTHEQIEETLKYMLLCAERVGQMTKTYNDIDAVTRLLEEKERDLELAARIGQSLLKKNRTLTERNEHLEERVEHAREEVSQLRHELSMKDELLQFYTNAAEESESDSTSSTPLRRIESTSSVQNYFHLDSLQRKLKDLEEENVVLRTETCHLQTETISYEEKEQQLVNDCVKELRDANLQLVNLAEELAKKTEDSARQQEEITHLLSQIVDLQKKSKAYAVENEELTQHLSAAKDAQRQLTAELRELEDKYAECMEMLHEAQEEIKNLRNKTMPNSTPRRYHSLGLFPLDSLAAEIEGSMRKELQMDTSPALEQKHQQKRVFETVRTVNQAVRQRSQAPSPMNIPGSNQSSAMNSGFSSCISTPRSSFHGGDITNIVIDNKTNSILLETESNEIGIEDCDKKLGQPGTPGSRDLQAALRRLSLRRENYLCERRFFEDERERKLQELAEKGEISSGSATPTESIMSLGTNLSGISDFTRFSGMSFSSRSYLPEKLQIVKPLEGSATLHHWQQLAQPNLGGILDPRPGVVTKGFRPLELDTEQVYHLTDYEEDEPGDPSFRGLATSTPVQHRETSVHYPGKCMSHTSSTFTFTTCRILHPSDELAQVTSSVHSAPTPVCGILNNIKSTPVGTPCTPRRLSLAESFTNLRESTTTMSISLGLVKLLKERGISAAVYNPYSCDRMGLNNTANFHIPKPTFVPSTPPNSPLYSLCPSPSPFECKGTCSHYDNFLASKPASSMLKEMRGDKPVRHSESQTDVSISKINLVDKVKRLGIAKVVQPSVTPVQESSVMDNKGPFLNRAPGSVNAFVRGSLMGESLALGCTQVVTGAIGGIQLNTGIRRNRSFPTMVGASMQMKGPAPLSSGILMGAKIPKQTNLQ